MGSLSDMQLVGLVDGTQPELPQLVPNQRATRVSFVSSLVLEIISNGSSAADDLQPQTKTTASNLQPILAMASEVEQRLRNLEDGSNMLTVYLPINHHICFVHVIQWCM